MYASLKNDLLNDDKRKEALVKINAKFTSFKEEVKAKGKLLIEKELESKLLPSLMKSVDEFLE